MILYSGRKCHRHVVHAMERALHMPNITDRQKTCILEALQSPPDLTMLSQEVARVAKQRKAPDPGAPGVDPVPPPTPGDHPFLNWLMTVFIPVILPLILKLFGLTAEETA